jgi:hypothetical protein
MPARPTVAATQPQLLRRGIKGRLCQCLSFRGPREAGGREGHVPEPPSQLPPPLAVHAPVIQRKVAGSN